MARLEQPLRFAIVLQL